MHELISAASINSNYKILGFSKEDIYGNVPLINRLDEKEFRYNGSMYDIVREEVKEDSVYFYCILDKKETLLELLFTEHLAKQTRENSPQNISSGFVFKFLPDYLLGAKNIKLKNYRSINYFNSPEKFRPLVYHEILTPPPQISEAQS